MRCLFYALLFTLVFPASAYAAGETTVLRNEALGFSLTVPGDWANRRVEPVVLEGQEFQAAYWGEGELGKALPFILVRSVETGKVKQSDMTGLNKIAMQSTMNGINPDLKPVLAVQNFYPHKSLFSYSVEQGADPDHRVLLNKYVYYTEKGMLEFTMVCGFKDTETMVTTNLVLKNAALDPGVEYGTQAPSKVTFLDQLGPHGKVIAGVLALVILLGAMRFLRKRA
ncbi:hypothetical protein [Salidesulfovibrio onnuriiensis]|uniref:hypothetical protein n=1 Tax=Salidesulfovibrio onnuriiensis TaxID=2583823 RepID=UPI0011C8C68A|nr:hypothetical protein [Salidesulfovibrio onnuriiensis]